jgi:pimeloyl-ACP methyl ester carboxylesterase
MIGRRRRDRGGVPGRGRECAPQRMNQISRGQICVNPRGAPGLRVPRVAVYGLVFRVAGLTPAVPTGVLTFASQGSRWMLATHSLEHQLETLVGLEALARALLGSSEFYESLWRERATLASIPALIVWGAKDAAFRPRHLARWRDALPNAAVVQIDSAGHWPHEERPDDVASAVSRFVGAVESG